MRGSCDGRNIKEEYIEEIKRGFEGDVKNNWIEEKRWLGKRRMWIRV